MNTGFLGPAVATVPTVYGIETRLHKWILRNKFGRLQQYLPFTVLKHKVNNLRYLGSLVATVPTVYGIETSVNLSTFRDDSKLQQYLPFTVLKHTHGQNKLCYSYKLQQYLPFTVLKLDRYYHHQ